MTRPIGIIGGSGMDDPNFFEKREEKDVKTPYGKPSGNIQLGTLAGVEVAFIPRHGPGHIYPPHKVPYHANIWALKELGVKTIVSPCSCGSLKEGFHPGEIVVVDQFIDFTKTREYSFYNEGKTVHISVAEPFCPELRKLFHDEGKAAGIPVHEKGTYVCIEGPRFSTKAESQMYRQFADIVGMTLVPEAQLAREAELCYVSLAMVTDYDVWKEHVVSIADIVATVKKNIGQVQTLLTNAIPKISESPSCGCGNALNSAEA